jgi:hypothetical protein
VVGLVWSSDPESYASGSITTGKASHARQVKGDDPNKKGLLVLQFGVWALGFNPTPTKYVVLRCF